MKGKAVKYDYKKILEAQVGDKVAGSTKFGIREQGQGGKVPLSELQGRIDAYFDSLFPRVLEGEDGQPIKQGKGQVVTMNCPSINGLCRWLGYDDPSWLSQTLKRDNTLRARMIRGAIMRIAEYHESRLADKNNTGSIFWLQRMQRDLFGEEAKVSKQVNTQVNIRLTPEEESRFRDNLKNLLCGAIPEGEVIEAEIVENEGQREEGSIEDEA